MSFLSQAWHLHSHSVRSTRIRQQFFPEPWQKSTKFIRDDCNLQSHMLWTICPPLSGSNKDLCRFQCHAVLRVGLRPIACWECGLESRRRHGCLSVMSIVCCQVEFSVPLSRGVPLSVCVCVCVLLHVGNKQRAVCFSTNNPTGPKFA